MKGIKRTSADIWFSKALRLAHPICQICGWREATQLMHIKTRANHATRYCVDNALAGCFHCHRWQEQHPLDFAHWFNETYPGRKDRIDLKARGIFKNTPANRKLVAAHYRVQYAKLMEDPDAGIESWN